jgi:hypothetical protein
MGKTRLEPIWGWKYEAVCRDFPRDADLKSPGPMPQEVADCLCKACKGGTLDVPPRVDEEGLCTACEGMGSHPIAYDRLDGVKVAASYSAMIRQLPNLRVKAGWWMNRTAVYFAFGSNGQGILMGCKE